MCSSRTADNRSMTEVDTALNLLVPENNYLKSGKGLIRHLKCTNSQHMHIWKICSKPLITKDGHIKTKVIY